MRIAAEPPADTAAYSFRHPVRVRFGETDAMGIVHHSSYLLYLEEARVAYLRHIGRPYAELHASGLDIAVLEVWVGYKAPVRFDEVVDIAVAVTEARRATFTISYSLSVSGEQRASAVTVHGCVDGKGRARRLPEWLRAGGS
jgi:acyl-CoA thioester hydrolase